MNETRRRIIAHGARRRVIALALASAIAQVASGCGEDVASDGVAGPTAASLVDVETARRHLLLGTGGVCADDRGCGPDGARGVCVLGTCFGLLTTDSGAARAVLAERVAALSPAVADDLVERMAATLQRPSSMPGMRMAAAIGISALAARRPAPACGAACDALATLLDEPEVGLAATARHGLTAAGDARALAAVVEDLGSGTEHLRAAAARACAAALAHRALSETVLNALVAALDDRSPVVRRIAAEALVVRAPDAETLAALHHARSNHPADLGYVVDRGLYAHGLESR